MPWQMDQPAGKSGSMVWDCGYQVVLYTQSGFVSGNRTATSWKKLAEIAFLG